MATRVMMLLGVLGCPSAAEPGEPTSTPEPVGTPGLADPSVSDPAPAPGASPTATQRVLDEGWSIPATLRDPVPELVIDWERPPPKGVPAAERRRSPSQLQWELLVDAASTAPQPLDDVSRPCRRQHFLAHDTRPLRTVESKYDEAGRLARERVDDDTDGTIDLEHTYTWGADGLLERERHVTGAQPSCSGRIPESVVETRHRYDEHGVWLGGQTFYDGRAEDKTAWRTSAYDQEGRVTRYLVYPTHEPQRTRMLRWAGDDELVEWLDYTGPSVDRIERWLAASDGVRWHALWSGGPWQLDRTVHDASGHPLVTQHDTNGDGRVDGRTVWSYDAQGRQLAEERDTDGDGDVDERIELEHDAAGHLVGRVHAGPAGTKRETWKNDAGGRLVRWTSKVDESWVEDVMEHVYDASGRELERQSVHHHAVSSVGDVRNYVTREHWRGERDGEGRLLRAFVSEGELGPDERIEYQYDCSQRYHRHPRRNPLDDPARAAECMRGE